MNRNIKIIIAVSSVIAFLFLIYFFSFRNKDDNIKPSQNQSEQPENTVSVSPEFTGGKSNSFTIISYGGKKDVKTLTRSGVEYALTRNPSVVGDLELAVANSFGNYYFTEYQNGEKIEFKDGDPEGRHGYEEIGLISNKLLRSRRTETEYFAAYPDSLSAQVAGIVDVPDSGSSNRFLQDRYLRIKNLNNNISIVVEIDTRSNEQGTLMVSEATRRALRIDNGAEGFFTLELVPTSEISLGVERIFND